MSRGRILAAITALFTASALGGCGSVVDAVGAIDACRAAQSLSATPADDPELLVAALNAFAAELPDEIAAAASRLGVVDPGTTENQDLNTEPEIVADQVEAREQERLNALLTVQTWVLANCDAYVTIGAPVGLGEAAEDVHLADVNTVVARNDAGGISVAVVGVESLELALALCEQAKTEYTRGSSGAVVTIRVVNPIGLIVAETVDGVCAAP